MVSLDPSMERAILKFIPNLRAFAISLCRNPDRADELVQETLTHAIAHIDTFNEGSNLEAWLITILRNCFNSEYRKSQRTVQDTDGRYAEALVVPPNQVGWGIAKDLGAGLAALSSAHRRRSLPRPASSL